MKKPITQILYLVLVGLIALVVITYAQATKVLDFLNDQKEELVEDEQKLLQAFVISSFADGTDIYIEKDPLYSQSFKSNNGNYELDLNIYNVVIFNKDERFASIAFIIDNVDINWPDVYLDELKRPIIDAKLLLDEPLIYNNHEYSETQETFVWAMDSNIGLFYINYELLTNNDGYVNIEEIQITFRNQDQTTNQTLINLGANTNYDVMPEEIDRNIDTLQYENIKHLKDINTYYLNDENIFYDTNMMKLFNSYNKVYFMYLGTYILIVAVVTYFAFFHSYVLNKRRIKKEKEKKKLEEFKKSLETEKKN